MSADFKKHALIISIFLFSFSALGLQISAQGKLEFPYPTIPGADKPTSVYTPIPLYFKYIYNLAIFLSGFLTFFLFCWGAIKYIFSTGNPALMADAKSQITNALLGFIIVFTSYLLLQTINPQLVMFPILTKEIQSYEPIVLPGSFEFKAEFEELPLGTLITSEYTLSSFLATDTPDLPATHPQYITAFLNTSKSYPSEFQGLLHGKRLKRIHEVASTTIPIVDMMFNLASEFVEKTNSLIENLEELRQLANECQCSNCICSGVGCGFSMPGQCSMAWCGGVFCRGDPCPPATRKRMVELRNNIIPSHYIQEDYPIPCKIAEIEYTMKAYQRFLSDTISKHLVKNQEFEDNRSWWHSDEAAQLRAKIQACIAAGNSDQERLNELEALIDMMAEVENKGTRGPQTDIPERDIAKNFKQMEAIYKSLLYVKDQMNPYLGPMEIIPWHGLMRFQAETQITTREITTGQAGNLKITPLEVLNKKVDTVEDPATFYTTNKLLKYFSQKDYKKNKNSFIELVWAQSESLETKASCSRMVEIPIGKALDETLRIGNDILRELRNIITESNKIMKALSSDSDFWKGQIELAEEIMDLSDKMIDLTDPVIGCKSDCQLTSCRATCTTTTKVDKADNVTYEHLCSEPCMLSDISNPPCPMTEIIKTLNEAKNALNEMKKRKSSIASSKEEINKSFKKLDSKEPIGEYYCCENNRGNCRDEKGVLKLDDIKNRKYTLKSKLVEIQKLLNRSRELVNPNREKNEGKSVYQLLLEQMIEKNFANKNELKLITAGEKLDLTNCNFTLSETAELAEQKEVKKTILNCKIAEGEFEEYVANAIKRNDKEVCSPDPLLDCDYFNPSSSRKKRPYACYCYDEDINQKKYPINYNIPPSSGKENLSNNLFCCVLSY